MTQQLTSELSSVGILLLIFGSAFFLAWMRRIGKRRADEKLKRQLHSLEQLMEMEAHLENKKHPHQQASTV